MLHQAGRGKAPGVMPPLRSPAANGVTVAFVGDALMGRRCILERCLWSPSACAKASCRIRMLGDRTIQAQDVGYPRRGKNRVRRDGGENRTTIGSTV